MRGLSLLMWVVFFGLAGCAIAPPTGDAPEETSASGEPVAWRKLGRRADVEAIRTMAGVFDVTYETFASAGDSRRRLLMARPSDALGLLDTRVVAAREAWLVSSEEEDGIVLEQLLLVGDPLVVARLGSQVWTPYIGGELEYDPAKGWELSDRLVRIRAGTWRVRASEPDGRPLYDVVGRWEHDGPGGVSRFVQNGWGARPAGARSAEEVAAAGGWRATTTLHVEAGEWLAVNEGEAFDLATVTTVAVYERAGGEASAALLAEARRWWALRAAFWSVVRDWWDARLERGGFTLREQVDGRPMWSAVLALGERAVRGELRADGYADAVGAAVEPYVLGVE